MTSIEFCRSSGEWDAGTTMEGNMLHQRTMSWAVGMALALVVAACAGGVSPEQYAALQTQLQTREQELRATVDQLRAREGELAKLQKERSAVPPPFGIAVEAFDASGKPAYEVEPGTWLAFVQSGMAYDSPADANYVSVVEAKSRKILAQVAVDMPKGYQSHGLGVSADARWVYVPSLSGSSKKLHILDGRTLKLAKTLDVGSATHHVDEGTYKQTGKFILVDTSNPEHGQIVLDPNKDNEVVGRIPFGTVLGRPYSGWSSPDGSFAYVTVNPHLPDEKGWISKIDLSTYKEIAFFPVGVGPVWVAFTADGKTAWVSNTKTNNVMRIKVGQTKEEKDEVVATVPLSFSPYGVVLTPDGQKLYTVGKTYGAADASTSVHVIDTEARKVIKHITVGKQPDHLFLSPDGKEVWVTENRGNQVSIIDTATDTVVGAIPMRGDVHSVRFVQLLTATSAMAAAPRAATASASSSLATPGASAAPSSPSARGDARLVAQGEKVFQETAACFACHGKDAKGLVGPDVRGKTADDVRFQLKNNEQMVPLKVSDGDIEAVGAYLQSLPR
ncbi:MAG: hypothetical protein HYY04_11470 [Chloroflexi bacterium]|nr:hypothetical protein [Chloroflexota bacterium]